jgi:hypothetical protein
MSVIIATQEVEIRKIVVPGQPEQKVYKTSSQPIRIWVWWHLCTKRKYHDLGWPRHKSKTLFRK